MFLTTSIPAYRPIVKFVYKIIIDNFIQSFLCSFAINTGAFLTCKELSLKMGL